jgi:Outer membrane protein beta-barrel domain
MKKNLVLIFFLLWAVVAAKAQSKISYNKKDVLINLGIGIENSYWKSIGLPSNRAANPSFSIEYAISKKVSVGATASYLRLKTLDSLPNSAPSQKTALKVHYRAIFLSSRASYHFFASKKTDAYAALSMGYINPSIGYVSDPTVNLIGRKAGFGWGIHFGARYYISPGIGVYGELGMSRVSVLNAGATFNLK